MCFLDAAIEESGNAQRPSMFQGRLQVLPDDPDSKDFFDFGIYLPDDFGDFIAGTADEIKEQIPICSNWIALELSQFQTDGPSRLQLRAFRFSLAMDPQELVLQEARSRFRAALVEGLNQIDGQLTNHHELVQGLEDILVSLFDLSADEEVVDMIRKHHLRNSGLMTLISGGNCLSEMTEQTQSAIRHLVNIQKSSDQMMDLQQLRIA